MNSRYLIFCNNLSKTDIKNTEIIDIYDKDFTQQSEDVHINNTSQFHLLGVHFPFEMIENLLRGYTENITTNVAPLRIKVYLNSHYSHDLILEENGAFLKQHFPMLISLYHVKDTKLSGPMLFDEYSIWEVTNNYIQIQIVSVYKYNKDKLQIDI